VLGGRGSDTLNGGDGDDAITSGEGKDQVQGGAGRDTLYTKRGDTLLGDEGEQADDTVTRMNLNTRNDAGQVLGSSIVLEGDEAFQARVRSDLDTLRSLPAGREMLLALDNSGRTTTIRQAQAGKGSSASAETKADAWLKDDGTPGTGTNATVQYNLTRSVNDKGVEDWQKRPPIAGLFHELVHAYNFVTGTLVKDPKGHKGAHYRELAAVGLPYDHDKDPSTPDQHPGHLNENQLREQLGVPARLEY